MTLRPQTVGTCPRTRPCSPKIDRINLESSPQHSKHPLGTECPRAKLEFLFSLLFIPSRFRGAAAALGARSSGQSETSFLKFSKTLFLPLVHMIFARIEFLIRNKKDERMVQNKKQKKPQPHD